MLSVNGYFDGQNIIFIENEKPKKNQKVIVTLLDDFLDPQVAALSLDEQIVAAALKRNPKRVSLPVNENGDVIVDKEKHPDIYEWAVNG